MVRYDKPIDCSYKPLSFDIQEQFRFNDTISTLYESFTELGIKYRLGKGFSFKGNYRYIVDYGGKNDHRLALDFNYSFDKKGFPLIIDYRLRFQNVMGRSKTYVRNKIGLTYKLTKLVDPYMAYELFYRFNGKNEFRKTRFTIGLEWRIMKELHCSTYFRVQDDINVKNPERQKIIGLTLNYKLKLKKNNTAARAE